MTSREAIDAWNRYRDSRRVVAAKPDDHSVGTGMEGIESAASPDYYGYLRVEEALSSLCKLRSQRDILTRLLVHAFANGAPLRTFNACNHGWEHESMLQNTVDAIFDAIEARLKAVPKPEMPKSVEMA